MTVGGRVDGIREHSWGIVVEEVKSVALTEQELATVSADEFTVPVLQLRLYGLALAES